MNVPLDNDAGALSVLYRIGVGDLATDCRELTEAISDLLEYAQSEEACDHLEELGAIAEEYADVLEEELLRLGAAVRPGYVAAIAGMVDDTDELLTRIDDPGTQDTALIGAASAAAYYVLARFSTIACHAKHLGHETVADELDAAAEDLRAAVARLDEFTTVCVRQAVP